MRERFKMLLWIVGAALAVGVAAGASLIDFNGGLENLDAPLDDSAQQADVFGLRKGSR
jgi:hypothetical protein